MIKNNHLNPNDSHLLWRAYINQYIPSAFTNWPNYINNLDIGIYCDYHNYENSYVYIIEDEKKWLLARIKYGI